MLLNNLKDLIKITVFLVFISSCSSIVINDNMNKNNIFKINQKGAGINESASISIGGNHPPKNNIEPIAHISKIFAYSPNQNIAYIIPEYSVW